MKLCLAALLLLAVGCASSPNTDSYWGRFGNNLGAAVANWGRSDNNAGGTAANTANDLYQVTPNAYGLGVNSDQYGRPHQYRTQDGQVLDPIFNDGVKRNAYGLGVHMDQFGRPVYDSTP